MVVVFRRFRRVVIFRPDGGRFSLCPVSDKFGCLVERQVGADAIDEQDAVAVLHHSVFLSVIHLVHKAVFLGFVCRPPVCFIHPLCALIRIMAGLFGIQRYNALPGSIQSFQVVPHLVRRQIPAQPHADRVDHVGAVRCCHHLVGVAGNDGSGTGAQAVDVGGHSGSIAGQLIANGLSCKNITSAGVDVHGDFGHIAQSGEIVRKLFRGNFITPPARFRNIAVKKKLRFLAVSQIAEFPELVICRLRGRLGTGFAHRTLPPLFSPFRTCAGAYLPASFRRSSAQFPARQC